MRALTTRRSMPVSDEYHEIVIDKSFLQGCKLEQLRAIIERGHRILLTAEIGLEIFTTNEPILKKCFKNLLAFRDYIDFIDHLGTLFKVEIEKHIPCVPISSYFLNGMLNQNFNYEFNKEQIKHIKNFENDVEALGAQKFDRIVLEIKNTLPTITIQDIQNPVVIRKIYASLRTENLPPVEIINEQWAIFRRLQVDCMAAIEYLHSFRNGQFDIKNRKKEHNQIDFRIIIFALLTKGLASNDRLIRRYFKFLCPDGILFPNFSPTVCGSTFTS